MEDRNNWQTANRTWAQFTQQHPELGYKPGRNNFNNFLRLHRNTLKQADAIRLAKRQFWIAHKDRVCSVAFDCATGVLPKP